MRRRVLSLAALAVGLAVAPAHGASEHHNPIGMADPTGDANGAADVIRVTVANDTRGQLLFVVQAVNRDAPLAADLVSVRVDSDRSADTGERAQGAGVDYVIEFNDTTRVLRRWNGAVFEPVASTTLDSAFTSGGYAARISRSDLGDAAAIEFYAVASLVGGDPSQLDTAPNVGTYDYRLSVSHVEAMTPRWAPAAPRAGATFRLRALQVTLQTGDRMPAAAFSCRAGLAGKRLRGTGRGRCTFRLPATARGKRLVVAVDAAPAGGEAETGVQIFRVR